MSGARQYGVVRYGMGANGELPLARLLLNGQPKTYCVRTKLLMALFSLGVRDEAEQAGFLRDHLADAKMIPRFKPGVTPGERFSPFRYEFKLRHSNGTTVSIEGLPNLMEALRRMFVPEWQAKRQSQTAASPTASAPAVEAEGPAAAVKRRRLSASAVAPATPSNKHTHTAAAAAVVGQSGGGAATQHGCPVQLKRSTRRSSTAAAATAPPPPPQEREPAAAPTAAGGAAAACGGAVSAPGQQASLSAARRVLRRSSSSAPAPVALPTAPAAAPVQPAAVPQWTSTAGAAGAPPPAAAAAIRFASAAQLPVSPHHTLRDLPAQATLESALRTGLEAAASAAAAGLSTLTSGSTGSAQMISAASQNPQLYENPAFLQAVQLVAQKELAQAETGKQVLELCHNILVSDRAPGSATKAAEAALAAAFQN